LVDRLDTAIRSAVQVSIGVGLPVQGVVEYSMWVEKAESLRQTPSRVVYLHKWSPLGGPTPRVKTNGEDEPVMILKVLLCQEACCWAVTGWVLK
jgi:hypothetical protein